jgi:ATP-dependent DNA helicase RecG
MGLDSRTTLERIQPHRLLALIAEDVGRYPDSAASDIHCRVGGEVQSSVFRRALKQAVDEGRVTTRGERRWRRYYPPISIEHED